ncbi:hypothetical protein MUN81_11765 [Hymenobacter sp. 5317J-9]|uniref:hypothetical protein n=1 Tax=Hymenobacter sp. 5317J-9 TaxID=2932250 RepID=UPI001FD701A7|nr:hypothetical protein [Hymenobacter sp. 5317J-9]UOQ95939.1 hypothetical protein MUN81_11765 [Hymenobacter sp. 5317J-9]
MGPALRARRAQLPAVARRYFELLAEEAWVPGTDRAERFELTGAGPGQLRLRVLAMRQARPDSLISERVYTQQDTKKLSLYGLAGNDIFTIDATAAPGMAVALYPGEGQDQVLLPTAAKAEAAKPLVLWYGQPGSAAPHLPGLTEEKDPEPWLSATAAGWLRRYNLQD